MDAIEMHFYPHSICVVAQTVNNNILAFLDI